MSAGDNAGCGRRETPTQYTRTVRKWEKVAGAYAGKTIIEKEKFS